MGLGWVSQVFDKMFGKYFESGKNKKAIWKMCAQVAVTSQFPKPSKILNINKKLWGCYEVGYTCFLYNWDMVYISASQPLFCRTLVFRKLFPSVPQQKKQIWLILLFYLSFLAFSVPPEVFLCLKSSVTIFGVKSVPKLEKGWEPLV